MRAVRRVLVLSLIGVLLLGCIMQGHWLLAPRGLEWVSRAAYRVVFLATVPLYPFVKPFIATRSHTLPARYYVIVCMATPFVWWVAWVVAKFALSRFRRRRRETPVAAQPRFNRRAFLTVSAAGTVAAFPGGLGVYATFVEPGRVKVRRYTAPIKDLPLSLAGFRLIHISDTHYGPYITLDYLDRVARLASSLNGDLVVMTGDYVHRTPKAIGPGVSVLQKFEARLRAVAVLGNHDHWAGTRVVQSAFDRVGVPLIDNGRLFLSDDGLKPEPSPGRSLCLAGLGDLWENPGQLAPVLSGVPEDMPRIVLTHNPDTAETLEPGQRVDLMCCGHTHGGQVWLPGLGTPIVPIRHGDKYAGGWCEGPQCPVVVSRGIGMAVLPVRFGVPPEIGVITLQRG
jgi:uncharacterized protein